MSTPDRKILIQYFRGECPAEEAHLVELYLAMELDTEYVEGCLREVYLSNVPVALSNGQILKAWNTFELRKINYAAISGRIQQLYSKWYYYAAALALLVLGTFLAAQFKNIERSGSAQSAQIETYRRVVAGAGLRKSVSLSDGTQITLFPGTVVDIPSKYNKRDRRIVLNGRAFFSVAHDKNKPFIVKSGQISTKVLGTSFEVNTSEGEQTRVTLKTGRVSISHSGKEISRLVPDQQIVVNQANGEFKIKQVNASFISSWTTGELQFDQVPLEELCAELEKWYGVEILIKRERLQHKKLTTSVRNEPVNAVLDMLAHSAGFKYHLNNKHIIIY